MTPEQIETLRGRFSILLEEIRRCVIDMGIRFPGIQVPIDATPWQLIRLLNGIEVVVVNTIARYLQQHIDFEQPLSAQQEAINRALMLDRHLCDLHQLFDEHITWLINHEPQDNIRQLLQGLNQHIMVYPTRDSSLENKQLLPIAHNRLLIHCYRAACLGLTQERLISQLSQVLNHQKVLRLMMRRSQDIMGLITGPVNDVNSWALEGDNGNPHVVREAQLGELNQTMQDALCDTQLTDEQYIRLNQLERNQGSASRMEFIIPLTKNENMAFIQNYENVQLGLTVAQRRMFGGAVFIRRDRQIGYYPLHILIMHDLIHVLHIAQGLSASQINGIVPLASWRGSDDDAFASPTEEFKTTVFDDISEHSIAEDMGIRIKRLPYVVFMLPLGKVRAYADWNAIEEMSQPLADYMVSKGFLLPERPRSSCCNLM